LIMKQGKHGQELESILKIQKGSKVSSTCDNSQRYT
jgi:hypothetical protein